MSSETPSASELLRTAQPETLAAALAEALVTLDRIAWAGAGLTSQDAQQLARRAGNTQSSILNRISALSHD